MNTTSPSEDALDALLSDFFKGQMKKPWPAAPAVTNAVSEPSALAAARTQQQSSPEPQPSAARDPGSRARYTLAASVAILLGTCWTLSNGFQPERPGGGTVTHPGPALDLHKSTAGDKKGFAAEVNQHGNDKKAAQGGIDFNNID